MFQFNQDDPNPPEIPASYGKPVPDSPPNPVRNMSNGIPAFIPRFHIDTGSVNFSTASQLQLGKSDYNKSPWPLGIRWVLWAQIPLGLRSHGFLAHKTHLIGNCVNFQWTGVVVLSHDCIF